MGLFKIFKKGNKTDDLLYYSTVIIRESEYAANEIKNLVENDKTREFKKNIDDKDWFSILFEFIYLFLHLTDRFAYGRMGDNYRHVIMKALEIQCIYGSVDVICPGWPENTIEKIKQECMENNYSFVEEYSNYKKLFPEKDESSKGTLFWEFGKNIAKLAKAHEQDFLYITTAVQLATYSFKELNIGSFINKVK